MELDGTILGKFGKAGKQLKEFSTVHEIDCRNPTSCWSRKSRRGASRRSCCNDQTVRGRHVHCDALARLCVLGASRLGFERAVPEILVRRRRHFALKLPADIHLGEVAGVATNSHGQHLRLHADREPDGRPRQLAAVCPRRLAPLRVRSRPGILSAKSAQASTGSSFAHAVRVDPQDNIWVVDEGSSQVIKFDPDGRVLMVMGRKAEADQSVRRRAGGGAAGGGGAPGSGRARRGSDQFNRPSDVAWDAEGNIFVADGYGNARVAKFDKNGRSSTSWGTRGSDPGQFNTPHSIATDAAGNVYVADQGNKRIQVFDNDGTFKAQIANVGVPTALCISRGAHQYLFSSNRRRLRHGRRGDLQAGAGRPDRREVRQGRQAAQGIGTGQRPRLPERERAVRRRVGELAGAEVRALSEIDRGDYSARSATIGSISLQLLHTVHAMVPLAAGQARVSRARAAGSLSRTALSQRFASFLRLSTELTRRLLSDMPVVRLCRPEEGSCCGEPGWVGDQLPCRGQEPPQSALTAV